MRLFVAIDLPDPVRREVRDATAPLREADLPVRWVEPDKYHVTMKFLGEMRPEAREDAVRLLRRAASGSSSMELELESMGAFPSLRRPRVLWVGVGATPPLRALKHDLEHAFARMGVEMETRAFRPHVTVGRAREGAGAGEFRALEELADEVSPQESFTVEHLELMRSRLRPEGAVYTVEERVPLGGED